MTLQELYQQYQSRPQTIEDFYRSKGFAQAGDNNTWFRPNDEGGMGRFNVDDLQGEFGQLSDPLHYISQADDGRYMAYDPGMTLDSPSSVQYRNAGLRTVRDAIKHHDPGFNEANWLAPGSAQNPFDRPLYQRSDQFNYGMDAIPSDDNGFKDWASLMAVGMGGLAGLATAFPAAGAAGAGLGEAAGVAGAFDAAGVGTGIDAGIFASDAGLSSMGAGGFGGFGGGVGGTGGEAGAFDAAGVGGGVDSGTFVSDAGLSSMGSSTFPSGTAGSFDASGVGTGVDSGTFASDAGLSSMPSGVDTSMFTLGADGGATSGDGAFSELAGGDATAFSSDTGAFDMGQFSASDVGLGDFSAFGETGAFDMGQFAPSDVGLGGDGGGGPSYGSSNFNAGPPGYHSEIGPTDEAFYSTFGEGEKAASSGFSVKDALGALTKYGPLALGGLGALQNKAAGKDAAAKLNAIGGPQRALGNQLLQQYQSGTLSANDAHRIDQWEQSAIAQARQFNARAGTANSTQAKSTEREIKAKAEAMRQQALQTVLQTGLTALNVTDQYQAAAIRAELQADQQATQSATNFLSAYGSWMRALPQITGQTPAKAT